MAKLAELVAERQTLVARGDEIAAHVADKGWDDENKTAFRDVKQKVADLNTQISELRELEVGDVFRAAKDDADKFRQSNPQLYRSGGDNPAPRGGDDELHTPGDMFVRSAAYAGWRQQFPDGGPPKGTVAQSNAVSIHTVRHMLGMRTATEKLSGHILTSETLPQGMQDKMRALVTTDSGSAGTFIRPDWMGLLEPGLVRPLVVRQLVTTIPTSTENIQYVREVSRVHAAAPVAEATAMQDPLGGTAAAGNLANVGVGGLKPEGGIVFALVTDVIKTLAAWVPATRKILADVPQLRAYIDQYLTDDMALTLEDQMVAGSGIGENFLGVLNTPGVQTQGAVAGLNNFDLVRRARRLIRINARTVPTAILINPVDEEKLDETKATGTGQYFGPGPYGPFGAPLPIWGMQIIESEAVPAGTALVGDFRRAVLFDREDTNIAVGTANDDFLRNIIRILAESRYGFGVLRPAAFVNVTLA